MAQLVNPIAKVQAKKALSPLVARRRIPTLIVPSFFVQHGGTSTVFTTIEYDQLGPHAFHTMVSVPFTAGSPGTATWNCICIVFDEKILQALWLSFATGSPSTYNVQVAPLCVMETSREVDRVKNLHNMQALLRCELRAAGQPGCDAAVHGLRLVSEAMLVAVAPVPPLVAHHAILCGPRLARRRIGGVATYRLK